MRLALGRAKVTGMKLKMPHVKNHRLTASPPAAKPPAQYYKGHRVLTLEEAARRKPPLPPEREWEEELR